MKRAFFRKIIVFFALFLLVNLTVLTANGEEPYGGLFTPDVNLLRLVQGWQRSLENTTADVVMFGDSITFGGEWSEAFPEQMIVNLGVSGDSVYSLAMRLPLLETLMPLKCFMLVGVNDLVYHEPMAEILAMYDWVLSELHQQSQEYGLTVYVQSVFPVDEKQNTYDVLNKDILALNTEIRTLAETYGMTYIDIHPSLTDSKGMLKEEYSYDGLHLTDEGYQEWYAILQAYMDE